jgi:tRNA A-37 threonylcarbamoyl transferase component Bud32
MLTNTEVLLGRTIAGYRLLQLVGQGGMGAVFLGQHIDEPKIQIAIKILLPFKYTLPEILVSFQARFMREAQAMDQLEHAHIVPMLSYGEVDGLPYIVMPYLSGGALDVRLNTRQEPLALAEIAHYMQQLASALDYAHQHGIVHCDIKPANVLLDADNNVYLTDFGIARLFESVPDALDEVPTFLTSTGEVCGTPAYMSPDLFRGQSAGPPSDIYALGIMLYRLVTGRVPFQGNGPFDVGIKHLCEEPLPPSKLRPELPEPAEATMLCALAKFPSERFTSAGELARSFEAGIKGKWTAEARAHWAQSSQAPARPMASVPFPTRPLPSTPAVQWRITAPVCPALSRRYMPFAGFLLTAIMLLALIAGVQTRGRMVGPSSSSTTLSSYPQDIPARLFTTPHVHPTATATATPSPTEAPSSPPATSAGAFQPPRNFTIAFINNDIYAVDCDNNTVLWNDEVNGHVIPPLDIFGNTIYIATHHGQIYALRTTDGALFWSYATNSFTTSPLRISDGIVYLSTDNGKTYELRADNGALLAILRPDDSSPTPTAHPDPTPTPKPGTTPTPTLTPDDTPTPTPGTTPTPDITPTATPDQSPTPTPGTTPTPDITPSPDQSPIPTPGTTPAPDITPPPDESPTPTPGTDHLRIPAYDGTTSPHSSPPHI